MKASMTHQEYQRLELISDSQSTKAAPSLRNIWQSLVAYLSSGTDLRVRQAVNAAGQSIWKVYDPMTQNRLEFASEQELRVWLEERYYQTPEVIVPYLAR